ncbi:hypothetical protein Q8W71_30740 [Methylobacterium sp. NEAU 140]|uniref:hypothetical protein n=1 Tax=Methylobacterium sp. NEAU 140 TaxID=3064945 RepID=UPI002732F745|nr:hypothetical protein [Methylobacterium sp. NEAU 140]MDP4026970.1 hypothetical protein [Methylobacterium sp. NEAU 140]
MGRLLDALRGRLGRPARRPDRTYGEPGTLLTNRSADREAASLDIADDLDASYPTAFNARLRSGFDPHRDHDGLRARAEREMSAELERTWEAGKPYSPWVSEAARRAGI